MILFTAGPNEVYLLDRLQQKSSRYGNYKHHWSVNEIVNHNNNQGELILCHQDGNIRIWNLGRNQFTHHMVPEDDFPINSSVASDGSMLVAGTISGIVMCGVCETTGKSRRWHHQKSSDHIQSTPEWFYLQIWSIWLLTLLTTPHGFGRPNIPLILKRHLRPTNGRCGIAHI